MARNRASLFTVSLNIKMYLTLKINNFFPLLLDLSSRERAKSVNDTNVRLDEISIKFLLICGLFRNIFYRALVRSAMYKWMGDAVTEAELLVLIIWKPTTYNLVVLVRKENR